MCCLSLLIFIIQMVFVCVFTLEIRAHACGNVYGRLSVCVGYNIASHSRVMLFGCMLFFEI